MAGAKVRVEAAMLEARGALLASRAIEGEAARRGLDLAIACTDLTTLEGSDTAETIRALCARASRPAPGAPAVAAVCVYPALVAVARAALTATAVRVAAVATGFPSGLVSLDVKLRETREALAAGADEVDMVLDRSAFLAGHEALVREQVAAVREACGGATLKVILEVGELGSFAAIRRAADLALAGGADFLKTATGKIGRAATPAVALALCDALAAHVRRGGRPAGLKLAGGIRSARAALGYVAIVHETLGGEWLRPDRLRFGASALLDDLLAERRRRAACVAAAPFEAAAETR